MGRARERSDRRGEREEATKGDEEGEKNTGSRGGERKDGERSGCVCAAQKSLTSLIKTCLLSGAVLQMPTPRGKPLSVTSHTHTHTHALANMRVCSLVGVCLRLMRKKLNRRRKVTDVCVFSSNFLNSSPL